MKKYGSTLIHAHHIEYFTKSLNNNPEFNATEKTYHYPNGLVEGLTLNRHIGQGT